MAGELGNNPAILNREFDSELRRISAYILQKKIGPLVDCKFNPNFWTNLSA